MLKRLGTTGLMDSTPANSLRYCRPIKLKSSDVGKDFSFDTFYMIFLNLFRCQDTS